MSEFAAKQNFFRLKSKKSRKNFGNSLKFCTFAPQK